MASTFARTFTLSAAVALVMGALFYLLAAGKGTASSAYTSNDVSMGVLFVVLLALIIGLSLWPSILERRPEEKEQ